MDKSGADAVGEAILYYMLLVLISSILLKLIVTLIVVIWNRIKGIKQQEGKHYKLVHKITFIAYGTLFGYYIFLFLTNFLENHQPAWEAYLIGIIFIVVSFLFSWLTLKYPKHIKFSWFKSLYLLFISLALSMIAIIIASFSFSLTAIRETNKIISKNTNLKTKYCIQPKIDTWLDLTPLTTWNKKSEDWEPRKNHAVLVIQNNKTISLYNWSYKSKGWDYLTTGFSPSSFNSPSLLRCTLKSNYSQTLPWLFPRSTQIK